MSSVVEDQISGVVLLLLRFCFCESCFPARLFLCIARQWLTNSTFTTQVRNMYRHPLSSRHSSCRRTFSLDPDCAYMPLSNIARFKMAISVYCFPSSVQVRLWLTAKSLVFFRFNSICAESRVKKKKGAIATRKAIMRRRPYGGENLIVLSDIDQTACAEFICGVSITSAQPTASQPISCDVSRNQFASNTA